MRGIEKDEADFLQSVFIPCSPVAAARIGETGVSHDGMKIAAAMGGDGSSDLKITFE